MGKNERAKGRGDLMSALKEIHRHVLQHYGNLILVDEPTFEDITKTWVAQLRTDYPRLIQDDRSPNERILKFLSLERLGTIRFSEDLKPLGKVSTTKEECIKTLNSFLMMWQDRAEKIVVRASSDQLARISETQWVLAPIREVVSNLLQKEMISNEEIEVARDTKGLKKYLRLLEELELVRRIENGYTYGNLFTALRETTEQKGTQEFQIAVLSHVIKERYSMLREVFGISQLEPFVHIDSSYYKPALEAAKILYSKRESIIRHCNEIYGYRDPLRITYILDELVRAGALRWQAPYYHGDEELFAKMLDMKDKLPELAPPKIGGLMK